MYAANSNLFSKIIDIKTKKQAYDLFVINLGSFWETHYTFSKKSPRRKKKLTKSFVDLLLINTIVPIQFAYSKAQNKEGDDYFELLREVMPEKNSIINKFNELGIESSNAFETQSLLELKNNYCAAKRCLECTIGLQLIKG